MLEQKARRLRSLADILANMPEDEAMNILLDMEREFRVDRESLNFLAAGIFRPEGLLEKTDRKELTTILRSLSLDSASVLIDTLDEKNRNLFAEILGKTRFQDAVSINRKPPRRAMIEEMLNIMSVAISKGELSYKGPALFLMEIPCRPAPGDPMKKGEVFFSVLNPVVAKDEGVRVLVYNPLRTEGELRLSFQQKGERYFGKEGWLMPLLTDDNGFYYAELFPERRAGMNTLWLEIPGAGQAGRNIYFTESARSVFSIMVDSAEVHGDGRCSVSFSLTGAVKGEDYARVRVFCSRCGHPVTAAGVKLENNSGMLEFNHSPGSGHSSDLFLHVQAGKHQACTVINTGTISSRLPEPVVENGRRPGGAVVMELPLEPGELFMYHVSRSLQADIETVQRVSSAAVMLHGKVKYTGERKSTVLEASESDGELIVMPSRDAMITLQFGSRKASADFVYWSQGRENFFDLYFTFYRLTAYGAEPLYRHVSRVDRNARIYPVLPGFIDRGESAEIEIMYRTGQEMQVSMTEGGTLSSTVRGEGTISSMVEYGHGYRLSCSGGGDPLSIDLEIRERGDIISWNSIEYIPPGTVISPADDISYTLYMSPMELCDEVRNRMLLNYPWGCAEQTAAKLSAMCWLYMSGKSPMPQERISILIQNGARKLLAYRKSDGIYSLFGRDSDMVVTMAILRHLIPLKKFRDKLNSHIPEVFTIIDDLVRICGNIENKPGWDTIPFNFGSSLDFSPYIDSLDSDTLIGNSSSYLMFEDGRFRHLSAGPVMSSSAYLSYVTATLIARGEDSLEAVVSRKKTVELLRRGGLAGLLEILGFLERKSETRIHDRKAMINNAVEALLRSIFFAYINTSSMSTVDMQALISLLSVIDRNIQEYSYASGMENYVPENGKTITGPVKVKSGFTFVRKALKKSLWTQAGKRSGIMTVSLSSGRIARGKNLQLKINRDSTAHCIYTIYYPAVLEPAAASGMMTGEQSVMIDSASLQRNGGITFRAVSRGRGRVTVLSENMYDTSHTEVKEAGWVEVF